MKRFICSFVAMALCGIGSAQGADAVRLTEAELTRLFAGGLTFTARGKNHDLTFVYEDNGDWTVSRPGADDNFGVWEIRDGSVCLTIQGPTAFWRGFWGRPPCNPIYRDGTALFWSDNRQHMVFSESGILARIGVAATQTASTPSRAAVGATDRVAETEALRREQEKLRQEAELERQRIAAEKRKLELMRLALEKQRLQQEQQALKRQQAMRAPDVATKPAPVQPDTTPSVIEAATALETKEDRLTIAGAARDDRRLTRVEVDGKEVAVRARDGAFSITRALQVGENRIRIAAFDAEGNKREHIVTVTRSRNIPEIAFGDFHALVIGIDDYEHLPKLRTAVVDARAVAESLRKEYRFKVRLLENPSRDAIIDALDDYRDKLAEGDNLLIYYAGHGWLDRESNRGYWLPVEAKADRRSRWFSNASLTDALQALDAKHVMVVADSCYSGTLTRSLTVPPTRDPDYIARMAEKRTRVVLSSGGLEPVSDSGGGARHSVFAAQFLKALAENQGVLDGTQLFEHVRHSVVLNANQTPEYSDIRMAGHEGGDFLFVRRD